ncbi:hypothetical protein XELAEV_18016170mg [Xenopus laevis]|uniref:Uncharacterized protein n=1 Tax=Xenopus laevis TaxID=8355 RepID=A0A974DLB1_XENLA|nr:hypothetical protein XELAEV_18016170mg [Xenopus laevis]
MRMERDIGNPFVGVIILEEAHPPTTGIQLISSMKSILLPEGPEMNLIWGPVSFSYATAISIKMSGILGIHFISYKYVYMPFFRV